MNNQSKGTRSAFDIEKVTGKPATFFIILIYQNLLVRFKTPFLFPRNIFVSKPGSYPKHHVQGRRIFRCNKATSANSVAFLNSAYKQAEARVCSQPVCVHQIPTDHKNEANFSFPLKSFLAHYSVTLLFAERIILLA